MYKLGFSILKSITTTQRLKVFFTDGIYLVRVSLFVHLVVLTSIGWSPGTDSPTRFTRLDRPYHYHRSGTSANILTDTSLTSTNTPAAAVVKLYCITISSYSPIYDILGPDVIVQTIPELKH